MDIRPHSSNIYGSSRRRKTDKTGLYFILTILAGFLFSAFGIWAIVEFILYLVKDDPFNGWSLGLTIAAFLVEAFCVVKTFFSDN